MVKATPPGEEKLVDNLGDVFERIPVRDGMTLSFHHHLRNGDGVVNAVLDTAAELGVKNLKVALSSVFPVHAPMVGHFESGTVAALDTDYISGPVAEAISGGVLTRPVVLRTHGGRARAIECGRLNIDVAFIAAPAADDYGNINGVGGPTACGSLGYAFPDAEYADQVVAVADTLFEYPLAPVSIPQTRVDYVVQMREIGDPEGIASGTMRITEDPVKLEIAEKAAEVMRAAGLIEDGFSFQTGAGGTSLAVTRFVRSMMQEAGVVGSFALGGITGPLVEMLRDGLFKRLIDVQDFDQEAIRSIAINPNHVEVGAGFYANGFNSGCAVNKLDCVILGATQVDTSFNVNVVTGSDGTIIGGSGGHSDTAAGAKLSIVVANLTRGSLPIVMDEVLTATTPGESIDVVVTDHGVAVNPRRSDLVGCLTAVGLPISDITDLKVMADETAGTPQHTKVGDKIVAVVEYRDGTVIDVVRQTVG
jgi:citrate lyase subunit alpha/citrate CoA-transferase